MNRIKDKGQISKYKIIQKQYSEIHQETKKQKKIVKMQEKVANLIVHDCNCCGRKFNINGLL